MLRFFFLSKHNQYFYLGKSTFSKYTLKYTRTRKLIKIKYSSTILQNMLRIIYEYVLFVNFTVVKNLNYATKVFYFYQAYLLYRTNHIIYFFVRLNITEKQCIYTTYNSVHTFYFMLYTTDNTNLNLADLGQHIVHTRRIFENILSFFFTFVPQILTKSKFL